MAQVPSPSFNYGYDAVARSSGVAPLAMFAPSGNNNVPNSLKGTAVAVTAPTNAPGDVGTPVPASVFQFGPGLYWLLCDGNGNNDLTAMIQVNFNAAGALAGCVGGFSNSVSSIGVVAGAVNTNPYQLLYNAGGVPVIFQNTLPVSTITYSCTAWKMAN